MKLLHWYHDIMNLYGDYGNVKAMERILQKSGEEVAVERRSLGDEVNLIDYDFIFVGSGTENNMKVVLADLMKYKNQLKDAVEGGKAILMTGNSFEMLGDVVTAARGTEYRGLGLYSFKTTEQNKTRDTADAVFEAEFLDSPLVGFVNKCSEIHGIKNPMFTVKMGLGNENNGKSEGMRDKNLFMTHLTGPVLVKNPHFLVYIASLILGRQPKDDCLTYERRGYDVTLKELINRIEH